MPSSDGSRRVRVERGIYRQTNGRYAVCVMVDGQPRFRTLNAATLGEVRIQRELLQNVARIGELPVSPRLTFAEVAGRWLAEFEAKVAAGQPAPRPHPRGRAASTYEPASTMPPLCAAGTLSAALPT